MFSLTKVSDSKKIPFSILTLGFMGVSVRGRLIFLWFELAHVGFQYIWPHI